MKQAFWTFTQLVESWPIEVDLNFINCAQVLSSLLGFES